MEAKRQLDVLDCRLAESKHLAGTAYEIADIDTFLGMSVAGREAPRIVNCVSGKPASQLHERHIASDFDTKTEDKLQP
jgi:GSH-dependent disulfide-bond oxidoreductase